MMKRLALVLFLIVISGCSVQEETIQEPEGMLKGVSLSPRSNQAEDFTGFFEKAKEAGNMVMWAGDWNQLRTDKGAAKVVTGLAETYGYMPLVEATFHSNGELVRPLNEENKKMYKDNAVAFAEEYKPKYLGLGIEVNGVYVKSKKDFEAFVPFYNEVYDAVKAVSPNTKVFTVFQLERMKGLTLWEIEENEPHWELIDRLKSDLAAFTTYPGLFYRNPKDILPDHYTEILLHTTKPVAFTEIGWHSAPSPIGWKSSEAEQAEFIETFFNLTKDMDKEIIIWSFLYDMEIIEPFDSMGLMRKDGTPREAWEKWLKLS
ncbi:MAG: hypothetical protein ABIB71_01690 [Candidatus Woesearchaeota archaeon]